METGRIKILSIDDNQDNLVTLKALIKEAVPDALTFNALDGEKGLELAAINDPDVILLDIVMPVMDGFEVCKKLKADNKLCDIPVVFITAQKSDKESRIRALEAGADAFLSKPIDLNELIAQIRAMVKIKTANINRTLEKERLDNLIAVQTGELKMIHIATLNLLEDLKRENDSRKKNEEELRDSEKRFRSLIENAFDGIYLTNGRYFYYVNNKFCEILGYTEQELTSPDFDFDGTLTEESLKLVNERARLRKLGKEVPGTYEFQIKTKNGIYKNVEVSTVNLAFGDELNVMGIVRDISDRKRMESQMIQSERLSALGEMSAGLAHEINQPLTTLSLIFDNILLESNVNHVVDLNYLHAKTEKIFENVERIRNIIDHVRAFSRSHNGFINASFNINESIKSALSMISMQYRINGIDLVTHFEKEIPSIIGNDYKFQQVILNLVGNAKDALLEKKNKIKKNFPMSIMIRTRNDKHHIKVEVEDNGIGIKPEIMDKVLLPFFTTKEAGKGTGLGLSISYGLIKEIKGSIDVRSEVLKGTTIIISLPMPEKT